MKSQTCTGGSSDADICGSSGNTIATIFEGLRAKDQIRFLWISDTNALFTAMVQVSVELRFSNPILAINALRRFDSSLLSLRKLAEYWLNAESIVRIFEESSKIQHGDQAGKDIEARLPANIDPLSHGQSDYPSGESVEAHRPLRSLTSPAGLSTLDGLPINSHEWEEFNMENQASLPYDQSLDMMALNNEWREIYWQEPNISQSFAEGFWGF